MKKILILAFTLFIGAQLLAQNEENYDTVLTLRQFYEGLLSAEDEYVLENALVYSDNYKVDEKWLYDSLYIKDRTLDYPIEIEVTFKKYYDNYLGDFPQRVFFKNITFKDDVDISIGNIVYSIKFDNCKFQGEFLDIESKNWWGMTFYNCLISSQIWIINESSHHGLSINQSELFFNETYIEKGYEPTFLNSKVDSINRFNLDQTIYCKGSISIANSKINSKTGFDHLELEIDSTGELYIDSSSISIHTYIDGENPSRITIQNSLINQINFTGLTFPPSKDFYFNWNQIESKQLELPYIDHFLDSNNLSFLYLKTYTGLTLEDQKDENKYDELIALHKTLYKIYQDRGDLESANGCLVSMKNVQTARLEYLYHQNKSLKRLLYWKLNVFLKVFAEYGTNPVKSIIFSIWTILIFAIYYFFVYSDWDQINRKFLINKHRKILEYFASEKNMQDFYVDIYGEKFHDYDSYKEELKDSKVHVPFFINALGKPLYRLSYVRYVILSWVYRRTEILNGKWIDLPKKKKFQAGFLVSVFLVFYSVYLIGVRALNSVILSLNTFSTLGFGDIPVKGFSRYVAVIEGFLGWFLLSIFSVSLISQIIQS